MVYFNEMIQYGNIHHGIKLFYYYYYWGILAPFLTPAASIFSPIVFWLSVSLLHPSVPHLWLLHLPTCPIVSWLVDSYTFFLPWCSLFIHPVGVSSPFHFSGDNMLPDLYPSVNYRLHYSKFCIDSYPFKNFLLKCPRDHIHHLGHSLTFDCIA